jgi:hypothetical protein
MGVFDRALRGCKVAWPDGCWNWNCSWSGEAAVLPDLRHCDITDSIEDDRIGLWRLSDFCDGKVDLARLVWGVIGWRSQRCSRLRSLVVVDVGESGSGEMIRGTEGDPGRYVSAGY